MRFRFLVIAVSALTLAAQSNRATLVPLDLGKVRVPSGFRISVYAQGNVSGARFLAVSPAGTLFVSSPGSGRVYALPDRNLRGQPDSVITFATGLREPHGLAFLGNDLYVAENHRVIVYRNVEPQLSAGVPQQVASIVAGGGHSTRTVVFGPDGRMYVAAGSSCNVCTEGEERRAAIQRFNPDGTGAEIFARGLRNSVGLRFHPATGELWATDNGRDNIGNDAPVEEINIIRQGLDYGWPYCHSNRMPNPEFNNQARCDSTEPPAWSMQAHSAPLGLGFYTGAWFPPEYRGDAFVALHGSWNRSVPTGYKVIRVRVQDGNPVAQEDFISGWLEGNTTMARPSDVVTGADGALYIADDGASRIYRVTYDGWSGPPAVNNGGITNAASFSNSVAAAPGGLISIFGANLLGRTWRALALPLPTAVDSFSVTIAGRAAELLYADANQVNLRVPEGIAGDVEFRVTAPAGVSTTRLNVLPAAPGIFSQDSSGRGMGAVRNATRGGLVSAGTPARAGDFLEIYATGLGGQTPVVTLGGRAVTPTFAGPAPGFAGLDQINIQVPEGLAAGAVSLALSAGGRESNAVQVQVQ
jgi:uncharacterized protein (TIGR03437 family)